MVFPRGSLLMETSIIMSRPPSRRWINVFFLGQRLLAYALSGRRPLTLMSRPIERAKRCGSAQLKNEAAGPPGFSMPSPAQILEDAPKTTKEVRVEANVVAYFGDLLMAWKAAVAAAAKANPKKN
jgi:hypothetical protein